MKFILRLFVVIVTIIVALSYKYSYVKNRHGSHSTLFTRRFGAQKNVMPATKFYSSVTHAEALATNFENFDEEVKKNMRLGVLLLNLGGPERTEVRKLL